MILRDYLELLQKEITENPDVLDMEVIYSIDTEGNDYQPCFCGPGADEYSVDGTTKKYFCLN